MRKNVLSLTGILTTAFLLFSLPLVVYGFQADLNVWSSTYPASTLDNTLGCSLCHASSKSQANATVYGKAVWGTSPISSAAIKAAEGADSDGDGATNIAEINANTDPSNPSSKPAPPPPADTPPTAAITVAKTTFTVNETATFSGSTSTDDKGISKYEWDFTSNGTIDATGAAASIAYTSAGTFKVTLKVTDTIGQTGSASVNITVSALVDTPPIAKITVAKTTFTTGETATFNGTGTDDKGISKYEWDLDGNGSFDATGVTASTTYAAAGSYKITLRVTDTIGQTGSASVTIAVSAPAPPPTTVLPTAKITASKTTVNINESVALSGSGSTGSIAKYEWDFTSDGSIDASGVNASKSYPSAGTYKATLKVTDTIGQTGTASVNITVNVAVTPPAPPTQPPVVTPPIKKPGDNDSDDRDDDRKKSEDEERKKRDDDRKKKEEERKKRK